MKLQWFQSDDRQHMWLFVGGLPEEVVWLQRRTKWWSAHPQLPGLHPDKRYAPLDEQKADMEAKVRSWFAKAYSDETAVAP